MPLPGTPPEHQQELVSSEFVLSPKNEFHYIENGQLRYHTSDVGIVYNPDESTVYHHGPGRLASLWRRQEIEKYTRSSLKPPNLEVCIRDDWAVEDLNRIISAPHVTAILNRIKKLEDPTITEPIAIAIVGTAGRQDDGRKLTAQVYSLMYQDCLKRIQALGRPPARLRLVSGGAA